MITTLAEGRGWRPCAAGLGVLNAKLSPANVYSR